MKRGGTRPDGSCKHKLNQRGEGPIVAGLPTIICGDCGAWAFCVADGLDLPDHPTLTWRTEAELIVMPFGPNPDEEPET